MFDHFTLPLYAHVHVYMIMYMYVCISFCHWLFPSCAWQELNIDAEEVESLMVSCILDSTIHGRIDQVQQILEVDQEPQGSARQVKNSV